MNNSSTNHVTGQEIAIISMTGRFPGAKSVEEFWFNLRAGVESISTFTDEELLAAGASPAELRDPNYVRANGVLDDIELFDASEEEVRHGGAATLAPVGRRERTVEAARGGHGVGQVSGVV